ncbi:MAG: 50S ribosomal protein L17 [Planctomycetota bacterium]|jgi:large subunit ribosomal protein L17|nr:50S ribosomal protein L17 [Planctomycetota bacterium]
MRHLNRGRKLNRTSSHRRALFRNLAIALFNKGRIITTPAKAKEARPFTERLITLAKSGYDNLAARRRAIRLLHNSRVVSYLFEEIGPRFKDRQGGYTRILHLARTRVGDGARQVLFEMVEGGKPVSKRAEKPAAIARTDVGSASPATETALGVARNAESTRYLAESETLREQAVNAGDAEPPSVEAKSEDALDAPDASAAQSKGKTAE